MKCKKGASAKVLFGFFNTVFFASGFIEVVCGFLLLCDTRRILLSRLLAAPDSGLEEAPFYYLALALLVAGLTICATAALGCWATYMPGYIILTFYFLVVLGLLLCECAGGVVAAMWPRCAGLQSAHGGALGALQSYYAVPDYEAFTAAMDLAQTEVSSVPIAAGAGAGVLRHERRAQLRHVGVAAAAARAARHVRAADLLRAGGGRPVAPQPGAAQPLALPGGTAQPYVSSRAGLRRQVRRLVPGTIPRVHVRSIRDGRIQTGTPAEHRVLLRAPAPAAAGLPGLHDEDPRQQHQREHLREQNGRLPRGAHHGQVHAAQQLLQPPRTQPEDLPQQAQRDGMRISRGDKRFGEETGEVLGLSLQAPSRLHHVVMSMIVPFSSVSRVKWLQYFLWFYCFYRVPYFNDCISNSIL